MTTDDDIQSLRAQRADNRELATVGLKAAVSSLAGMQALLQGIRLETLLGTGEVPEASMRQAEEHVERGLAILKEAIGSAGRDG